MKNGDLRAAKLMNPVSLCSFNEGGEFLVQKPSPSPFLTHFVQGLLAQVSSARPGELICIFFLAKQESF